ncbi:MAG: hypothetical protein IIC50_14620 [Planctomycetes bacterium]|nr:hypothetical protein [Planctomycetota bacterium]
MRLLNRFKMSRVWMLVFCVGFVGPSLGQLPEENGIWTTKSPMQRARIVLSSGAVNGKIYAIGGSPHLPGVNWVEEYDPGTDTWTPKAGMPTARATAASSVVNGKIYVIGGVTRFNGETLSTVEQYDPATDTWTTKANMPTARTALSSSVVDGKIYAIGGSRTFRGTPLTTVEQYDPATDTWTPKAGMPTARDYASASAVNGKIYMIGGATVGGGFPQGVSTVEEYDPATNTWMPKADMPTARTYFSTSVVNGKIFAMGGLAANNHLSAVEEYDPATDTWTPKAGMPTARSMLTTSVVNGKIYAIGGSIGDGASNKVATVEAYDPYPIIVDFNGDYVVDIEDLVLLIEHWGQDDPMYDIAPPFGDGVVDVTDLEVLMSFWGQEIDDPYWLAHWKLDETEGDVAYDSVGEYDAVVLGDAVWQQEGGQVGGALQLDGIDDYVNASFVLNPADGVFSVFAWVKGGVPGQVILSQVDGENWLMLDAQGSLKTTLKGSRRDPDLTSEVVISDDTWHRVGFTWDGVNRVLYVDDSEVARDTQAGLRGSQGDLTIGAGNSLDAGTFWSGMIDDVLIYDRAIEP